jgi:hypothetical protein
LNQDPHAAALRHLHAGLEAGLGALGKKEAGDQGIGVLVDQQHDLPRARDQAVRAHRHHGAVLGQFGNLQLDLLLADFKQGSVADDLSQCISGRLGLEGG